MSYTWCNLVTYDAITDITSADVPASDGYYRFFDDAGERRGFSDLNAEQIDGYLFVFNAGLLRTYRIEFEFNGDIYRHWEIK